MLQDVLCCITVKQSAIQLPVGHPSPPASGDQTADQIVATAVDEGAADATRLNAAENDLRGGERQEQAAEEEGGKAEAGRRSPQTTGKFGAVLTKFYLPVLATSTGQLAVLVLKLCMIAVAAFGVSALETGLDISDVIPTGTYQGDFLDARFAYFDFFNIQIVTKEADYAAPATQRLLLDMHAELLALRNEDGGSYLVQPPPAFWLAEFIVWVGAAGSATPPRTQRLNDEGLVAEADFYEYFYSWLELDSITVMTIQGQDFNYTCSSAVTETFAVSGPAPCAAGERGALTYAFMSLCALRIVYAFSICM